jgi:hypothetical protein
VTLQVLLMVAASEGAEALLRGPRGRPAARLSRGRVRNRAARRVIFKWRRDASLELADPSVVAFGGTGH